MAFFHNVLYNFALYLTAYSYSMAFRPLDYTNTFDRADIEDLVSRKYDCVPVDKNAITDAILATYKGFVITWFISNSEGEVRLYFFLFYYFDKNTTPCIVKYPSFIVSMYV